MGKLNLFRLLWICYLALMVVIFLMGSFVVLGLDIGVILFLFMGVLAIFAMVTSPVRKSHSLGGSGGNVFSTILGGQVHILAFPSISG